MRDALMTELAEAVEALGADIFSDADLFEAHGTFETATVYRRDGNWLIVKDETTTVTVPDTLPVSTVAEIVASVLKPIERTSGTPELPAPSPEGVAEMRALLTPPGTILVTVDDETYYPARLLARSGLGDANGTTLIEADAERWNGFLNPLFTRDVMEAICADWSRPEMGDGATYEMLQNGAVKLDDSAHYPDDPDGGISHDTPREQDGLYGTFTFGYTWYSATEQAD